MQPEMNIPSSTIASSKVEGTNVYDLKGDKLGSIDDLVIEKSTGRVHYAVLEFGGFLGIATDLYPLPWSRLQYDTTKDGYVVDVSKEQLQNAPKYTKHEVPSYSEEYGRRVYQHYGAPWIL